MPDPTVADDEIRSDDVRGQPAALPFGEKGARCGLATRRTRRRADHEGSDCARDEDHDGNYDGRPTVSHLRKVVCAHGLPSRRAGDP